MPRVIEIESLPQGTNGAKHYNGITTINAFDLTGCYVRVQAAAIPDTQAAMAYMIHEVRSGNVILPGGAGGGN